uniref:Glycosyltransferase n=1 Tax=Candidatus Desulfatibia profunda TaxID=2841695 RepID=A0A8J6NXP0_9BACT|nr:glycosyltransferase [Candidatus Desulfatibia profunda]
MNVNPVVSVSIVIPVYNEAANLEELIRCCVTACDTLARPYEIILVDDGSNDDSAAIITRAAEQKHGNIIGVTLNRNYGQHAAVMAGFSE